MLPGLKEYSSERREEPMGDRREVTGWRAWLDNKVTAPLIVIAVLAALASLAGVFALPAQVTSQNGRIVVVEGKVDGLERREIRAEEKQSRILEKLDEIREDIKQLRGRR